jgi:hypothetical protein
MHVSNIPQDKKKFTFICGNKRSDLFLHIDNDHWNSLNKFLNYFWRIAMARFFRCMFYNRTLTWFKVVKFKLTTTIKSVCLVVNLVVLLGHLTLDKDWINPYMNSSFATSFTHLKELKRWVIVIGSDQTFCITFSLTRGPRNMDKIEEIFWTITCVVLQTSWVVVDLSTSSSSLFFQRIYLWASFCQAWQTHCHFTTLVYFSA